MCKGVWHHAHVGGSGSRGVRVSEHRLPLVRAGPYVCPTALAHAVRPMPSFSFSRLFLALPNDGTPAADGRTDGITTTEGGYGLRE